MFVVVVVAVSPHLEGVLHVDAYDVSHEFVEPDGLEVREVRHVVELHEDPHHVEAVDGPTQQVGVVRDEEDGRSLDEETGPQCQEGPGVVGTDVLGDVLIELLVEGIAVVLTHRDCYLFNKLYNHQ